MNSVIDDEYIETEKGVILEEFNMCLDNESRDVFVKNMKQALSNSKFASDIVGKNENNIKSIKFKDLKDFKNKYFVGNNFIVSMVTSLNYLKAKRLIEKHFVKNIPIRKDYQKPKISYDLNVIDKDS
jgi:predicted Zn-dependent peptidase